MEWLFVSSVWNADVDQWAANGGVRPPWVPCAEDIGLMMDGCPSELLEKEKVNVLVLGVTPGIIRAPWPSNFALHAVDYDPEMIKALWLPDMDSIAEITCADWTDMPFPDAFFDLVVGDGSFCALPSLEEYPAVLREILRVKRADAAIISRFFMQSDPQPNLHQIVDLASGAMRDRYSGPDLRLFFLMAIAQPNAVVDHRLAIPRILQDFGDFDVFIGTLWPDADEAWKTRLMMNRDQRLNFPTFEQIKINADKFSLEMLDRYPNYTLGQFCPTIVFKQK